MSIDPHLARISADGVEFIWIPAKLYGQISGLPQGKADHLCDYPIRAVALRFSKSESRFGTDSFSKGKT